MPPQTFVKQAANEIVMRGGIAAGNRRIPHRGGNHAITKHNADAMPIIDVSHGNNARSDAGCSIAWHRCRPCFRPDGPPLAESFLAGPFVAEPSLDEPFCRA